MLAGHGEQAMMDILIRYGNGQDIHDLEVCYIDQFFGSRNVL